MGEQSYNWQMGVLVKESLLTSGAASPGQSACYWRCAGRLGRLRVRPSKVTPAPFSFMDYLCYHLCDADYSL